MRHDERPTATAFRTLIALPARAEHYQPLTPIPAYAREGH
jgi:hypothetical protein